MKKFVALIVSLVCVALLLSGCAGTTVIVGECKCEQPHVAQPSADAEKEEAPLDDAELLTGLAVITSVADSVSATAEDEGAAKYDVTIAAVTVDGTGVIRACRIDSVPATIHIDTAGTVTTDLTTAVPTKDELGADYGMVAWGEAIAEWDEQVAALEQFAVGKTVEELKNGAIDETGKAPKGSDLASSATIYLGGYVAAVEAAVENAQKLGARSGDELVLVTLNALDGSAATADAAGNAQLDVNIAAITRKDGVITSCLLDAVQAKVAFDVNGAITADLSAPILTKNELGADYGMVAWGEAIAEWNEQAASFAEYVTGKTAEEVAGIAVEESTKPAEGTDLATSVTIAVGGFQALIAKAMQ